MRAVWLVAGLLTTAASVQASAPAPFGTWMTKEGDSRIRISSCGKALCATIVWTKEPGTDGQNPDPGLRSRNIVGVDLSRDMQPDGSGGWLGSIYNPDNGKTYRATMRRRGESELEVGGCILGGLLCGSDTWLRQPDGTASVMPAPEKPARR